MIAVIFEVLPNPQHRNEYFSIAKDLRPVLETIDGFISIERFESLNEPGKVLSLSFWRNVSEHRIAQHKGRNRIFDNYRLRVAHVMRDYGMHERAETPDDSRKQHDDSS